MTDNEGGAFFCGILFGILVALFMYYKIFIPEHRHKAFTKGVKAGQCYYQQKCPKGYMHEFNHETNKCTCSFDAQ